MSNVGYTRREHCQLDTSFLLWFGGLLLRCHRDRDTETWAASVIPLESPCQGVQDCQSRFSQSVRSFFLYTDLNDNFLTLTPNKLPTSTHLFLSIAYPSCNFQELSYDTSNVGHTNREHCLFDTPFLLWFGGKVVNLMPRFCYDLEVCLCGVTEGQLQWPTRRSAHRWRAVGNLYTHGNFEDLGVSL